MKSQEVWTHSEDKKGEENRGTRIKCAREERTLHHDGINFISAKCSDGKVELSVWSFKNMVRNGGICRILLNTSVRFKKIEVYLKHLPTEQNSCLSISIGDSFTHSRKKQ